MRSLWATSCSCMRRARIETAWQTKSSKQAIHTFQSEGGVWHVHKKAQESPGTARAPQPPPRPVSKAERIIRKRTPTITLPLPQLGCTCGYILGPRPTPTQPEPNPASRLAMQVSTRWSSCAPSHAHASTNLQFLLALPKCVELGVNFFKSEFCVVIFLLLALLVAVPASAVFLVRLFA